MSKYKTALGRSLDLDALISKNERTRAVGNMKVNARGDTIDGLGRIVEPVTSKVTKGYSKTVGNKSAKPIKQNNNISKPVPRKPMPEQRMDLSMHERQLEDEMKDDEEIENIKAQERKNNE